MKEAEKHRQILSIRKKMHDLTVAAESRIEKECTGADGVLDREMADRVKHTYRYIKGDYMNEYLGAVWTLLSPNREAIIIKTIKERGSFRILSFTERYQKYEFTVSGSNREKIIKLDDLAVEANRLLNEPIIEMTAFVNLAILAAEVCEHPVMEEGFRKCLREVLPIKPS